MFCLFIWWDRSAQQRRLTWTGKDFPPEVRRRHSADVSQLQPSEENGTWSWDKKYGRGLTTEHFQTMTNRELKSTNAVKGEKIESVSGIYLFGQMCKNSRRDESRCKTQNRRRVKSIFLEQRLLSWEKNTTESQTETLRKKHAANIFLRLWEMGVQRRRACYCSGGEQNGKNHNRKQSGW